MWDIPGTYSHFFFPTQDRNKITRMSIEVGAIGLDLEMHSRAILAESVWWWFVGNWYNPHKSTGISVNQPVEF